MNKKIKIWLKAVRPQFFTATIVPVTLGAVISWHQFGSFNWPYFLLALIGGLFIHAGLDLANDYYDHTSGVDDINRFPTPFSAGSRVIQEKLLTPGQVIRGSIFCFLAGSAIGLYLNFVLPGNTILIIGIIGVFLAFFYTADPIRIGYTGFGELSVWLGFGPVMVLGSYYVQCHQLSWLPFLASVPVGILIALVLYINEFPDYEADKKVNKRTLVIILGKKKAIKVYYLLLGFVYLWVILGVITKFFPYFTLIVFITVPLFFKAVKVAKMNYDKIYELLPANAATIGLHLTIGLLLSVGFILNKLVK
ncbi:MAG: 1,4-dihydroxy-2-naphthoate octaprenyltransferase [Elusimicrobiota bacterium]